MNSKSGYICTSPPAETFRLVYSIVYEELHSLYRSPNTVRVIKSRRLRWAGLLARMEESRSAFKILTGKPTGKRPLGVDERTILEWTLKK